MCVLFIHTDTPVTLVMFAINVDAGIELVKWPTVRPGVGTGVGLEVGVSVGSGGGVGVGANVGAGVGSSVSRYPTSSTQAASVLFAAVQFAPTTPRRHGITIWV
jgi:hypothetical protein